MNSGGYLLSHTVASAVPSALLSLTSGAGNAMALNLNGIEMLTRMPLVLRLCRRTSQRTTYAGP